MVNYLDEINFLNKILYETFWPMVTNRNNDDIDGLRIGVSSYWAASYAVAKCYDNPLRDPIEILDEYANTYQVEGLFDQQDINKKNYNSAYLAIEKLREKLIKRRKKGE